MNKKLIILTILTLCLPLFACSAGGNPEPAAPGESTDTDQPEDVVAEATASLDDTQVGITFVTNIDQIVGTWIATADLGNFVAVITPDGKFRVATSTEDLERGSTDTWTLTFEEDQILATGFALCLGDTGSYLAVINEDGTLKFTTIADPCTARFRKMDRSLPGRLTPYDLIYHLVK